MRSTPLRAWNGWLPVAAALALGATAAAVLLAQVQPAAPGLVAAAAATLALLMTFLWWRRRERLHACFALGLLSWALLLAIGGLAATAGIHGQVWIDVLRGFVTVMLLLFCLRLANWRWPRFERVMLIGLAAAPLLLYAALLVDPQSGIPALWRALLLALGALAGLALLRAAPRRERPLLAVAVVLVGIAALPLGPGLAVWLPYAGLLLALLVARLVIDRVLQAEAALEAANAELGRRVAEQGAELNEALDQMRRSRDAARAADLAKTRFLAAASHDLRQPAHALGLYMAALREAPLAPEQREIAERMSASLAALDSMFAALLDVSRIDSGAVAPRWELVPLAPLLRRLADEWAPAAEAAGLRLSLRLPLADAVSVSDGLLLERVLRNLLANAVKYTRSGGVLLACRSRRQPGGEPGWRLEVWDSGVGIAAGDQELVFDEFFQVGNPGRDRNKAPGLGLGLAIVRRLLRLLQLRLRLRSVPGRGSVFIIDGLAAAGRVPQQAAAARDQMRRLAGTLVAVIDDDGDVRDATRRLLRLWECEVVTGADANEVQQQLRLAPLPAQVPKAIVADVRLADGRRGPDEAEALFAAWGHEVPLLLVSGETGPEQLRQLQHDGHTCLAKPVSPVRLRAWLEQAVQAAAMESPR